MSAGAAALVARAIARRPSPRASPATAARSRAMSQRSTSWACARWWTWTCGWEGTGALLALPIVQSAARAMHDVATFDAAGVTEK
ncbi:nicotinate-nucleotide--dimethylbenzimidazole phosphoribosyltransferase [Streptomyces sp. M10(2022)]